MIEIQKKRGKVEKKGRDEKRWAKTEEGEEEQMGKKSVDGERRWGTQIEKNCSHGERGKKGTLRNKKNLQRKSENIKSEE